MTMITFDQGTMKFIFRVVGIAIENSKVLLCKVEPDGTFWFPPGGRAELLETSVESVRREMKEELGEDVTVERLLWVAENFFHFQGFEAHELGMYYRIRFPDGCAALNQHDVIRFTDGGSTITCKWHDLDALDELLLYPVFLRDALHDLPGSPRHIIVREAEYEKRLAGLNASQTG